MYYNSNIDKNEEPPKYSAYQKDDTYIDPPPYAPPTDIDFRLREFQARREINENFMSAIKSLGNYDLVYICDDSGSMSQIGRGIDTIINAE